jgi:hypothetical protein
VALPTLIQVLRTSRIRLLQMKVWAPHAATIVIGVTFVITLLFAGRWAYTDVLADLASGMSKNVGLGVLLLIALYVGALLGGWTAGRWGHVAPSAPQLLKCLVGGVLMGGFLLIPGLNDGLILIGILLHPYAAGVRDDAVTTPPRDRAARLLAPFGFLKNRHRDA